MSLDLEPKKIESFDKLSKIKCKIEKKGRFDYVSWAEAWKEVKKVYPDSTFKVYETESGFPAFIKPTVGGFVKVGVTVQGIEHIEVYPIINNINKSIAAEMINAMDINNAIKRALAKALALHGLGLHLYYGEDLPEDA